MRFPSILFFSCIVILAHGQTTYIDSLQRLINKQDNSKEKVELMNLSSFALLGQDIEKAGNSTLLALQVSKEIGYIKGEGWAAAYRGVYFLFNGSLKSAKEMFERALVIGNKVKDVNLQAYSLNQLGNCYRDKGIFDSAYQSYRNAKIVLRRKPDPFYQSVIEMNIGRYYLILSKPDSALSHIRQAERIREALNSPKLLIDVWIILGNCYRVKNELGEAIRYYEMVKNTPSISPIVHAQYLLNMGEVYFNQGNFPKALENWSKVLSFHRKQNYKYELAFLLYRMGEAFQEQGYYDLALEHLSNSLKISEKAPYKYLIGEVYYELAWVFYRNSQLDLAKETVRKAEAVFKLMAQELRLAGCLNLRGLIQLKQKNYDSSLYFNLKALNERERIGSKGGISSSLYNLGDLMNRKGEYQKALRYLWRGLKIDLANGDKYGESLYCYMIGKTYNKLGALDSAKHYLDRAINIAIPVSSSNVLRNVYFEMADNLQKKGNPTEAITYYKQFITLSDSLFDKQATQSIASFRTLYDVEKKEQEIEILNKTNLLVKAQALEQKTLFYVALIISVVLVALAIFYYRFTKRLKKVNLQMLEKGDKIQVQSEELTKANMTLSHVNQELASKNDNLKAALNDLHATQKQLIQAEKMASLGILSSGVAHELNNPLNFIKGGANALFDELQNLDKTKQEEVQTYFNIINEGVNRASAILKGLSHFSRQTDKQNEDCNVHKIIDNCLLILNNKLKHRIAIEKHYCASDPLVTGNEGRLHQAFLNILSNAEQAITGNGTISIETMLIGDNVSVSIIDSGLGISEENISKISDPFFTTKAPGEGTGLGLSITYAIIEDHKGKITLTSKLNTGTKFVLLLPKKIAPEK